ncbi:MAG TPA: hypothetical protein VGQ22_25020 [Steroidobacteraceae bacterium]|nr:hypothetical protein [Steroidobacteraceae bacterium]
MYNEALGTPNWKVPPEENRSLHIAVQVRSHAPSGWSFTIPQELRRKGWLPEASGIVVLEYSTEELNVWTEAAYNEETVLELE